MPAIVVSKAANLPTVSGYGAHQALGVVILHSRSSLDCKQRTIFVITICDFGVVASFCLGQETVFPILQTNVPPQLGAVPSLDASNAVCAVPTIDDSARRLDLRHKESIIIEVPFSAVTEDNDFSGETDSFVLHTRHAEKGL